MDHSDVESLQSRIAVLERENIALRESVARGRQRMLDLAAIIANTPAPVYLKDPEFRYLFVNRRYEELARVNLDLLRGKTDFDIFPKPVAIRSARLVELVARR